MANKGFSILILAAGKATRFKSEHSKMLHRLAGRPLGAYALEAAIAAGPERTFMVIGHESEEVREMLSWPEVTFIEQKEQLGTGHALLVSRGELERSPSSSVVVLVGDAPLLQAETLRALVEAHDRTKAAATILSTRVENPLGYGRIVRGAGGRVRAIVEEKVCTPAQKKIRDISSGILCFSRKELLKYLPEITDRNAQKEYLLTELIEIFNRRKLKVMAFDVDDSREVLGVNDRVELARVEKMLRLRKAEALMREGVTIVDPACTYIDAGVVVGRDTVIEPGVSLLGATRIGEACTVKSWCTLTDAVLRDNVTVRQGSVVTASQVANGASVGPFAHLREGALVEEGAHIGNFVEVKKSRVGRGTKSMHLTYIGDASIGEKVNVGAGTVTCNYDGETKHPTSIGDGVFIGSGSMLVAPVRIGKGAYVAAGSTITEDVPPEALALGRARQVNKEGWARSREMIKPSVHVVVRGLADITIFDISGRLTVGAPVTQLKEDVRPIIEAGRTKIILNLSRVTYVDSAGLGALVGLLKSTREAGGQLKLCQLTSKVSALLETAALDKTFEVYPDEAAAHSSFA
ncbi:MAG: bifunctional UDP-N-acetylglucosamine diphosphorylase/glucosamine-1-phosphate N-acetyltransferase GlmU [Acidobacteria bacterium]|nr:bifunctional UDP-N-acetylglucosamine diphosphorylase/glucosamine-1-phosphate N-acetyltransferase GlmU [Acidobacteriota bacterium]